MSVVMSPSNLKTFRQCPYKFYVQYIERAVPYIQSDAAARGEKLHTYMEDAIKNGWDSIIWPEPDTFNNAKGFVKAVQDLKNSGWRVATEIAVATDGCGNCTDWSEKYPVSWMRSRVDLLAVHPEKAFGIIIDWKTGKPWDDGLQLYINTLCVYPKTKLTKYLVAYSYIDMGIVNYYNVELSIPCPRGIDKADIPDTEFGSVLRLITDLEDACVTDTWPATKNRFCSWCAVPNCPIK